MIFYFTATGNSKWIAEKIAEATGDHIQSITECVQNEQYTFEPADGEQLGFVVPVYFVGIPIIVAEFLQKLKVSNMQYSYAVLNCGGSISDADGVFQKLFITDAVFGIVTLTNYVPKLKLSDIDSIKQRLDKAEPNIDAAIQHIINKDAGNFIDFKGILYHLITFIGCTIFKNGRKTEQFTVNDQCIGCGLCQNICPRKVIKLQNSKPVWTAPQCELCLACLHRCPSAAINYGNKTSENGRFVNPYTNL